MQVTPGPFRPGGPQHLARRQQRAGGATGGPHRRRVHPVGARGVGVLPRRGQKLGRPDPGPEPDRREPHRGAGRGPRTGLGSRWRPYFLHETNAYGAWQAQDDIASPYHTVERHRCSCAPPASTRADPGPVHRGAEEAAPFPVRVLPSAVRRHADRPRVVEPAVVRARGHARVSVASPPPWPRRSTHSMPSRCRPRGRCSRSCAARRRWRPWPTGCSTSAVTRSAGPSSRDTTAFSNARGFKAQGVVVPPEDRILGEMDPPQHTAVRRVMVTALTPKVVHAADALHRGDRAATACAGSRSRDRRSRACVHRAAAQPRDRFTSSAFPPKTPTRSRRGPRS